MNWKQALFLGLSTFFTLSLFVYFLILAGIPVWDSIMVVLAFFAVMISIIGVSALIAIIWEKLR